jgi:hypothetical protein
LNYGVVKLKNLVKTIEKVYAVYVSASDRGSRYWETISQTAELTGFDRGDDRAGFGLFFWHCGRSKALATHYQEP